ncbi:FAD-dependent oxidoreductase [Membranihabitans maritimus]|uniref:FAD-dependent oxidoreductase n=1 Tax=Membranihabitans maritimus TaxID=2904244 RepID=UPI001F1F76D3|nr:FAD-dependent oxidoreductase [Membranihabitans maritimus]
MKRRKFLQAGTVGATLLSYNPLQAFSDLGSVSKETVKYCNQSERSIPVAYDVDVVVIGGSTAAISAAVAASQNLAKVCLVTDLPYLGDDICGTYRFWPRTQIPKHPISDKLYKNGIPTPLHVKRTLDKELIDNGVDFLYSSFVADVVTDKQDLLSGIIISNRSGSQAILAKTIIDATPRAVVARMSRAKFERFPKGKQVFKFITVGREANHSKGMKLHQLPEPLIFKDQSYNAYEYSIPVDMRDDSFASFAEAEQKIRDLTWNASQVDSGDLLFFVPSDPVVSKKKISSKNLTIDQLDLDAFIPKNKENLFVLGGCADIPRELAEQLLEPLAMLQIADQVGKASAVLSSTIINNPNLSVKGDLGDYDVVSGDVGELLDGLRPRLNKGVVLANETFLPVFGEYDTIVVGGGTSGAPATIGAASHNANTLVVEYMHGLGGIGTFGMVGKYYHGYRKGFTREIDVGVSEMGEDTTRKKDNLGEWVFDWKIEYYRREIRNSGGTIWFGVIGCGAYVDQGRVKGVVVATPYGKGVVLGHTIIDSTGGADIAISAGADFAYVDGSSVAVQGSGLPYKNFDDFYNNTDWTYIDDTDMLDVWRAFIVAKDKFKDQYDIGKLPQTRERRRVVGDFTVSALDIYNGRTYPDTISIHQSSFDTHGFTEEPFFALKPPELGGIDVKAYVPFRSLLPKGLEGIIVTGLGASAHRDAMPVIRMQACLQNQGYAVGWASSMVAKKNQYIRYVDIKALQKELVKIESLPNAVITDRDNYPPTLEMIEAASDNVVNDLQGLEIILWDKNKSIPVLESKFNSSRIESDRLLYALILGMCGNDEGWQVLQEKIDSYEDWDEGWEFKAAGGQFGASMSYLDSLIIALGKTKKKNALSTIVRLAEKLNPESAFSHFRAVSKALEMIERKEGAKPLYDLLIMEGMSGHSMPDIITSKEINEKVFSKRIIQPSLLDNVIRRNSLRELILARALYRCGDYKGLGKEILINYSKDLRGHFYRHASGVLRMSERKLY